MFLSKFRADTSDRSPYGNFFFSPIGALTGGGARVTAHSAMGMPVVFSCIRVLAESFAVMPFVLYQSKLGGGRTKNKTHWLYRLFAKAPNRFQTPYEWRLMLQGHLALRGNAFCQIASTGDGTITELLPLHPDRMTIETMDNGSYRYRYRYVDQTGKIIYYQRGEIWHLRGLSDDGYMGMSPISLAREAIGEGLSIQAYSGRFFANDTKPPGWIEYPGNFDKLETKLAFRESWQSMQGGENRGKVAVLERGMKFHEMGMTNKDSQFIEARIAKKSEIASIWRIPPHKIGDLSKSSFSNIEQMSIEFWTDTMLPYAELWESSIEYFLLGEDTILDPEFNMRRMMRGDSAARTAYYTGGINAGWLTRNEAREEEGYDPIDGLDEPLRPLNMVEESAAPDEIAEGPANTDDAAGPANDDGDEASARRQRYRAQRQAQRQADVRGMKEAMEGAASARVDFLLQASAARLARRVVKAEGKLPGADVIAEAMTVPLASAEAWLAAVTPLVGLTEEQLTASLVALGKML